ncbi:MAG: MFS transporter [Jatrophihabitans sp.]
MTVDAREADQNTIFGGPVRSTSIGMLILVTLIAFESMAVSAALPTAARDLHGLGSYGWAFTGFLVANIVGMVASGQISDRRGAGAPLAAGLSMFLVGLVLSGTAISMPLLVAGRVVQGLGSGLMITAVYVVIGQAYPERLRPPLFAAISSAWVLPALLGPIASGLLAQHASWRLVFLGLVPFTVLGGVLMLPALRSLERPDVSRSRQLDLGRLGRAVAVAAGVAMLEAAGQHPSPVLLVLAAVGLAGIIWGLHRLLPAGTIVARPGVAAPVALRGLLAGAFFGVEAAVPLSLTVQHHYSASTAGLPLAASGISWAIGSWWQGRGVADDGPRRRIALMRTGFGFVTLAAAGMAVTALPATPGWLAYPSWFVGGLGAGLTMSSVGVLLLRYTTDANRGVDSAALQLADGTASALTTGVAGVLVAAAARGAISNTTAFAGLDLLMCVLGAVGVLAAGRAHPASAAQTAQPTPLRTSL